MKPKNQNGLFSPKAKLQKQFEERHGITDNTRLIIELEKGLSAICHYSHDEFIRFRKLLSGKSAREKLEIIRKIPGIADKIIQFAKLCKQHRNITLEVQKISIRQYENPSLVSTQKKNELKNLRRKMNLTRRQLDSARHSAISLLNLYTTNKAARLHPLQLARQAECDPALGKRQRAFFGNALKFMTKQRKR